MFTSFRLFLGYSIIIAVLFGILSAFGKVSVTLEVFR